MKVKAIPQKTEYVQNITDTTEIKVYIKHLSKCPQRNEMNALMLLGPQYVSMYPAKHIDLGRRKGFLRIYRVKNKILKDATLFHLQIGCTCNIMAQVPLSQLIEDNYVIRV